MPVRRSPLLDATACGNVCFVEHGSQAPSLLPWVGPQVSLGALSRGDRVTRGQLDLRREECAPHRPRRERQACERTCRGPQPVNVQHLPHAVLAVEALALIVVLVARVVVACEGQSWSIVVNRVGPRIDLRPPFPFPPAVGLWAALKSPRSRDTSRLAASGITLLSTLWRQEQKLYW